MRLQPVVLPGPIHLVQVRDPTKLHQQVRDYEGLVPASVHQIVEDLNRAGQAGVPAVLSEPQHSRRDWSLLLYGRTYVVRLFQTQRQGGYQVAWVGPRRMRDHHDLTKKGCLLLRPRHWAYVADARDIPQEYSAYWPQIAAAWSAVGETTAAHREVPLLTGAQLSFLDTLDTMISAARKIALEQVRADGSFPYRDVEPAGERRLSAQAVYDFHLADGRQPAGSAFIQVKGEPRQRDQVTRVATTRAGGLVATVRFDEAIDWKHLAKQGELVVTPSSVVFRMQQEAVADLRSRQAVNRSLLSVMVDHRVAPIPTHRAEPFETLDRKDQLVAFRKALTVPDMLVVLGPPGTGKTRTISEIARTAALDNHERVLVTSHSNRAVDNVLRKLPGELLAVRVGNEGSVTTDGQPYLLELRATQLREEILRTTSASLESYREVSHAQDWARVVDSELDNLTQANHAVRDATAALAAARHAAGGAVAQQHQQLHTACQQREQAAARHNDKQTALLRRRNKAHARSQWPLLGGWFVWQTRRCDSRIAAAAEQGANLRRALAQSRSSLAQAEVQLESVTRDDPSVLQAKASATRASDDADAARNAAYHASQQVRQALREVATPPSVRAGSDRRTTEQDLAAFRTWQQEQLPLLAARVALLGDWHAEVSQATDQLHQQLIRYADVVAATCIGTASRPELSNVEFDLAIVDEAGQIGITDALVPLARAKRAVLVGDHRQLPPFLDTEVEAWGASVDDPLIRKLLATSALEQVVAGLPATNVVLLHVQRRMPETVADFISATFYQGKLTTGVDRTHRDPLFDAPMSFVDTKLLKEHRREKSAASDRWGQSGYVNPAEAELLVALAEFYHHRNGDEWAVIVPYRAQAARISAALVRRIGSPELVSLNVGTVDSFQGGERDVILYGFTRSNSHRQVGFLRELRRTNVAFTRVKQQLVLVGDLGALTMAADAGFRELARSLRDHVTANGEIREYHDIRDKLARLGKESDSR